MADGTTSSTAANAITHTVEFLDLDDFYTCLGGRRTLWNNNNPSRDTFVGMINKATVYTDEVTLADLQAMVSYTCDAPCPS